MGRSSGLNLASKSKSGSLNRQKQVITDSRYSGERSNPERRSVIIQVKARLRRLAAGKMIVGFIFLQTRYSNCWKIKEGRSWLDG